MRLGKQRLERLFKSLTLIMMRHEETLKPLWIGCKNMLAQDHMVLVRHLKKIFLNISEINLTIKKF